MALNFEKHAAKGNKFVKDVAEYLGDVNRDKAGRQLKAVLHALRDILTVEESLHLIAQLPLVIKGIYVDAWKVSGSPRRIRSIDHFCDDLKHIAGLTAEEDFPTNEDCLDAVHAVFSVIKETVSPGEIEDIRAIMPKELKELWDEKVYH
ncbi:MAG: DUF2267 domain-containing protein [Bacteroidetes bacterium]|nr:DUF2267 domain-containing protein [Bacteroidota bacterium]HET6244551.1 DUF2267 domain-containing protein [Bacteroidia bacterium]